MYASNKNNRNRTIKNKKIKEGKCIFPFKYLWEAHNECIETPSGKICATETNPKTNTLIKYGFCQDNKNKSLDEKKSSEKNKKKMKSKISSNNNSNSMEINNSIIEEKKFNPPYNEYIRNLLQQLIIISKSKASKDANYKARAYENALINLNNFGFEINKLDQINEALKIQSKTSSTLAKIKTYLTTGTLSILEQEKNNPVFIFSKIYGVGPKKANDLVAKGYKTIKDLRELTEPELKKILTKNQIIGLKNYESLLERIPRKEIIKYNKIFEKIFEDLNKEFPNTKYEIVGSFRRGSESSGDIDLYMTNENSDYKVFPAFLKILRDKKILIETLSEGPSKSLTITKLTPSSTPRRSDFLYSPKNEYAFAVLYFTGSKEFNTSMRQYALTKGYSLNEHGLSKYNKNLKKEKITNPLFPDEKSIFEFLELKYIEPKDRKGEKQIIPIVNNSNKSQDEPEQKEKKPDTNKDKEEDSDKDKEEDSDKDKEDSDKDEEEDKQEHDKEPKLKLKIKKNKTLKKVSKIQNKEIILNEIKNWESTGESYLDSLSEAELSNILEYVNNNYYCNSEKEEDNILSDKNYDILRNYILKKYPNNKFALNQHMECSISSKNKVKLPYNLWSMNKLKPNTKEITKWKSKFNGPYLISCKLDGISALYVFEKQKQKQNFYTRGNGTYGQDITDLIPFIIWKNKKQSDFDFDFAIRGEIIIQKEIFEKKYSKDSANSRNFVAGIVNK